MRVVTNLSNRPSPLVLFLLITFNYYYFSATVTNREEMMRRRCWNNAKCLRHHASFETPSAAADISAR